MLRYIFTSIILLTFIINVNAQQNGQEGSNSQQGQQGPNQEEPKQKKKEKLPYPNKKRGTSLGIDVSRFLLPFFDEDCVAFEATIKTNFKKRAFLVGALGFENISFDDKSYEYKSSGIYIRGGIDYDVFIVDEERNNDNILFGFRYGMAIQQQQSDSYTISDDYWGDYSSSISPYTVNTHWIELVSGLRTEIWNNLYMSAYASLKIKVASINSTVMEPYRIPGFGKGTNTASLGFTYIVEYQIPWGNKKNQK